jgi:hypothetical protein
MRTYGRVAVIASHRNCGAVEAVGGGTPLLARCIASIITGIITAASTIIGYAVSDSPKSRTGWIRSSRAPVC